MYKADVIEYFGTQKLLTEALGLKSSGAVSQWGPVIPEKQALRLERITGGALKYDHSLYSSK